MAPYRPAPPYPQRPHPVPQPVVAYPPPRVRRSHAGLSFLIALGVTLVIVLVVGLANALSGSTSNPPVQAPAKVNDMTADWTNWLDQHYATTPVWAPQVTQVRMDVGAWDVVVSTTLSDQTMSLTVCQQASGFALDRGKTSVQVLDSAGLVLASKHTGGVCEWRR